MLNVVLIGLETDFPEKFHWDVVENMFLVCLTVELVPSQDMGKGDGWLADAFFSWMFFLKEHLDESFIYWGCSWDLKLQRNLTTWRLKVEVVNF